LINRIREKGFLPDPLISLGSKIYGMNGNKGAVSSIARAFSDSFC
jgi:hypothetical protein